MLQKPRRARDSRSGAVATLATVATLLAIRLPRHRGRLGLAALLSFLAAGLAEWLRRRRPRLRRPPQDDARLTGSYCAFLSHYKMEAAMEARHCQVELERVMEASVFLDSDGESTRTTLPRPVDTLAQALRCPVNRQSLPPTTFADLVDLRNLMRDVERSDVLVIFQVWPVLHLTLPRLSTPP